MLLGTEAHGVIESTVVVVVVVVVFVITPIQVNSLIRLLGFGAF